MSVFDPGLQLERTALAWQRTLLALAVASLAAGRGLVPVIGVGAWVLAGLGVVVSIAAFVVARRRYRSAHESLVAGRGLPGSATLLITSAALCLLAGSAALAFVLTRH